MADRAFKLWQAWWLLPAFGLLGAFTYLGWQLVAGGHVVARYDAGRAVAASFQEHSFARRTVVQTSAGSFLLPGGFPLFQGHPMVLERQRNGNFKLCDPALAVCGRVLKD